VILPEKSAEVLKVNQIFIINLLSKLKILTNANISQRLYCLLCYFILIVGYGWIYKRKRKKRVVKIIFFSWGSLTWWAIGASLIASNISAEQFIGMSGSGFKMGLAIATYEVDGRFTLIIVAVFFIPVYLKTKFSPYLNI
jgi:SSS family solute:Na+ symporter